MLLNLLNQVIKNLLLAFYPLLLTTKVFNLFGSSLYPDFRSKNL